MAHLVLMKGISKLSMMDLTWMADISLRGPMFFFLFFFLPRMWEKKDSRRDFQTYERNKFVKKSCDIYVSG